MGTLFSTIKNEVNAATSYVDTKYNSLLNSAEAEKQKENMVLKAWADSRVSMRNYFQTKCPALKCDFYCMLFKKYDTGINSAKDFVVNDFFITSLEFPQAGVTFSSSDELMGFNVPSIVLNNMSLGFTTVSDEGVKMGQYAAAFEDQFTDSGALKLGGTIGWIMAIGLIDSYQRINKWIKLSNLAFGQPIPSVSPQDIGLLEYRASVAYNNFEYGEYIV